MAGVPLASGQNDRQLFGYTICEHLDTEQVEERGGREVRRPKLQILDGDGAYGCPNLLRTLPAQTMDPSDSRKIAAGEDHWVVALAYFCLGRATPVADPQRSVIPYWMRKPTKRRLYGRVVA
jgi:hypothetical protein